MKTGKDAKLGDFVVCKTLDINSGKVKIGKMKITEDHLQNLKDMGERWPWYNSRLISKK